MLLRLCYLSLFLSLSQIVVSQDSLLISEITFKGLRRTKVAYVEQFLQLKRGGKVDSICIQRDVQTLKNLQIFNDVTASVHDSLGRKVLVYKVNEVVTRLPIVGLGWTDEVFWTELGGMDLNFFGKGIQCVFKHRYYQRNSYLFYLKNQHYKATRWGYELMFNRLATVEPLYFSNSTQFYNYDNNSIGVGLMYWLLRRNSLSFYTQYIYEDYIKTRESRLEYTEGPLEHQTNKLLLKFSNSSNYVNYNGVRLNGIYNYLALETIQSRNAYERFMKLSNELKIFKFIGGKGNLAFRLRAGVSTNNDTPFASFVADNYVNIRGIGDRAVRGTAEIASNFEYRQVLFTHPSINVATVGFVDAGSWRLPGDKLSTLFNDANIHVYSGIGLRVHFLMLYNAILRADYTINAEDSCHRGLILGVGQYF